MKKFTFVLAFLAIMLVSASCFAWTDASAIVSGRTGTDSDESSISSHSQVSYDLEATVYTGSGCTAYARASIKEGSIVKDAVTAYAQNGANDEILSVGYISNYSGGKITAYVETYGSNTYAEAYAYAEW